MTYREIELIDIPLPSNFTTMEQALEFQKHALLFEANSSMSTCIDEPEDAYLHPVDIDSSEPGIVCSKTKMDILRRQKPFPKIMYEVEKSKPRVQVNIVENESTIEDSILKGNKRDTKLVSSQEKNALREVKSEEKSQQKIAAKEDKKRQREQETKEERDERLKLMRERREARKIEKEAELLNAPQIETSPTEMEEMEEISENISNRPENNLPDDEIAQGVICNLEEALALDSNGEYYSSSLLPTRIKARNRKTKFFCSPVPHDRHLNALTYAKPPDDMLDTFLTGRPSDSVILVQGPPGTGKTHQIVDMIKNCKGRVLVCSNTNTAAANVYTRCLNAGIDCSLLLSKHKIPHGTPLGSQSPYANIVCCTISGRNGFLLASEEFPNVFVDEANQCTEAHIWGLFRPHIKQFVMVGDVNQLPAQVSDKGRLLGYDQSLMQRLIKLKYPVSYLSTQRRMHPDIVSFPNKLIYDNTLKTEYTFNPSISAYNLIDIQSEEVLIGSSFKNELEGEKVLEIAQKLKETYTDTVIIAPYQAQCRFLLAQKTGIPVHTVDSFQGREADAVVLSMVRTSEIGFWSDARRLNVALTRAKHCMRIVGSINNWSGPLKELASDAHQRKMIC